MTLSGLLVFAASARSMRLLNRVTGTVMAGAAVAVATR